MDILTKTHRSWNMSRIRCKDTKPEVFVRSILHKAGYRFRKTVTKLPGKPDIVLPRYKLVIFIHGCFWHRHKNCKYAYMPKTRITFWEKKFARNITRQIIVNKALRKSGWKIIEIWECQTKIQDFEKRIISRVKRFTKKLAA